MKVEWMLLLMFIIFYIYSLKMFLQISSVNSFTDKPWWSFGDKNNPFNSGVLYIKRKVGACSYVDDPIGCQSLLSRAMHKVVETIYFTMVDIPPSYIRLYN